MIETATQNFRLISRLLGEGYDYGFNLLLFEEEKMFIIIQCCASKQPS